MGTTAATAAAGCLMRSGTSLAMSEALLPSPRWSVLLEGRRTRACALRACTERRCGWRAAAGRYGSLAWVVSALCCCCRIGPWLAGVAFCCAVTAQGCVPVLLLHAPSC